MMAEEELPPDHEMMALIPELAKVVGKRKTRLFACACCRRNWPLFPNDECRWAVVVAEQFVDGLVGTATLGEANVKAKAAHRAYYGQSSEPAYYATEACYLVTLSNVKDALKACESACRAHSYAAARRPGSALVNPLIARDAFYQESTCQTHLLRDLLGNPSLRVESNPSWFTPTVVDLARSIYGERAFDRLPLLAAMLQEAGCDNAVVLNHCRNPHQIHVRGCWVVDLVLGKV